MLYRILFLSFLLLSPIWVTADEFDDEFGELSEWERDDFNAIAIELDEDVELAPALPCQLNHLNVDWD